MKMPPLHRRNNAPLPQASSVLRRFSRCGDPENCYRRKSLSLMDIPSSWKKTCAATGPLQNSAHIRSSRFYHMLPSFRHKPTDQIMNTAKVATSSRYHQKGIVFCVTKHRKRAFFCRCISVDMKLYQISTASASEKTDVLPNMQQLPQNQPADAADDVRELGDVALVGHSVHDLATEVQHRHDDQRHGDHAALRAGVVHDARLVCYLCRLLPGIDVEQYRTDCHSHVPSLFIICLICNTTMQVNANDIICAPIFTYT